jgi:hypothetical protein
MTPPIGIYRSAPKIEKFMRACNVAFKVEGSRVPSLVQRLINLNNGFEAGQVLPRIIEAAADPRDFTQEPERHVAVLDHLNRALRFDGFELQQQGGRMRLIEAGKNVPVLAELAGLSEVIDFDTVSRDLDRALAVDTFELREVLHDPPKLHPEARHEAEGRLDGLEPSERRHLVEQKQHRVLWLHVDVAGVLDDRNRDEA